MKHQMYACKCNKCMYSKMTICCCCCCCCFVVVRSRIGQKHALHPEEAVEEEEENRVAMEVDQVPRSVREDDGDSPFASLAKRPKPLYSDRPDDLLDITEMMGESEKQRVLAEVGGDSGRVGLGGGKGDLRRALQQRKKRRNLKLRVGHTPRLVEQAP